MEGYSVVPGRMFHPERISDWEAIWWETQERGQKRDYMAFRMDLANRLVDRFSMRQEVPARNLSVPRLNPNLHHLPDFCCTVGQMRSVSSRGVCDMKLESAALTATVTYVSQGIGTVSESSIVWETYNVRRTVMAYITLVFADVLYFRCIL